MTTIENIGIGIARYIDGELASKTDGLKKWGLSLASVLLVAKITEMANRYSDVLKSAGYVNENGMVDDVKLLSFDSQRLSWHDDISAHIVELLDF